MTHVGVGDGWLGRIDGMPTRCGTLVITGDEPVVAAEQIGGEGGTAIAPRVAPRLVGVVPEVATVDSVVPETATVDPDWTPGAPTVVDVVVVTVDVGAGMIPLPWLTVVGVGVVVVTAAAACMDCVDEVAPPAGGDPPATVGVAP